MSPCTLAAQDPSGQALETAVLSAPLQPGQCVAGHFCSGTLGKGTWDQVDSHLLTWPGLTAGSLVGWCLPLGSLRAAGASLGGVCLVSASRSCSHPLGQSWATCLETSASSQQTHHGSWEETRVTSSGQKVPSIGFPPTVDTTPP